MKFVYKVVFYVLLALCFPATPGRLNDLLMNEILTVKSVTYLVSGHPHLPVTSTQLCLCVGGRSWYRMNFLAVWFIICISMCKILHHGCLLLGSLNNLYVCMNHARVCVGVWLAGAGRGRPHAGHGV